MDLARLEKNLKAKISKLYFSKFPLDCTEQVEVQDFDKNMRRLRMFQRKLQTHTELMKKREKNAEMLRQCRDLLSRAHDAISSGKMLMSIDIERSYTEIAQEVGITIYQNGKMSSFNLRIKDTPPRPDRFHFGSSNEMTWAEAKDVVLQYANVSTFYVGHSLFVDFEHMKTNGLRLPMRPWLDTNELSYLIEGMYGSKLGELAAHLQIAAPHPHCGGNDARYNMEVLLAMVENYGPTS